MRESMEITYILGFKKLFSWRFFDTIIGLLTTLLWTPVVAQSNYEFCLESPGDSSCKVFFIKGGIVRVYEHPDLTSRTDDYDIPGLPIYTLWRENRRHKGWFFYPYNNEDIKQLGLKSKGRWFRNEDLAGARDFRRVIGCWPIIGFEAPEFFSVSATPEGQAYLGGGLWGDDGKVLELNPLNFHATSIWFTGNLVRFGDRLVPDWQDEDATRVFGYNPKTRKLDSTVSERSVTYYPDEKLVGCEGGLKLETIQSKQP